jgi:hypothetical protein
MKLKGIPVKGVRLSKEKKLTKVFVPRDASHAQRVKSSKRARPQKRIV